MDAMQTAYEDEVEGTALGRLKGFLYLLTSPTIKVEVHDEGEKEEYYIHQSALRQFPYFEAQLSRWTPESPISIAFTLPGVAQFDDFKRILYQAYHGKAPPREMTVREALATYVLAKMLLFDHVVGLAKTSVLRSAQTAEDIEVIRDCGITCSLPELEEMSATLETTRGPSDSVFESMVLSTLRGSARHIDSIDGDKGDHKARVQFALRTPLPSKGKSYQGCLEDSIDSLKTCMSRRANFGKEAQDVETILKHLGDRDHVMMDKVDGQKIVIGKNCLGAAIPGCDLRPSWILMWHLIKDRIVTVNSSQHLTAMFKSLSSNRAQCHLSDMTCPKGRAKDTRRGREHLQAALQDAIKIAMSFSETDIESLVELVEIGRPEFVHLCMDDPDAACGSNEVHSSDRDSATVYSCNAFALPDKFLADLLTGSPTKVSKRLSQHLASSDNFDDGKLGNLSFAAMAQVS